MGTTWSIHVGRHTRNLVRGWRGCLLGYGQRASFDSWALTGSLIGGDVRRAGGAGVYELAKLPNVTDDILSCDRANEAGAGVLDEGGACGGKGDLFDDKWLLGSGRLGQRQGGVGALVALV
jgi:hypothetical protein